ncbi:hypothetical protein [Yersinia frederiksenii]|uniref:hypothetical protein n=1 Tax=Yersinia frederiksenii TaxID=29484 RepID=UPI0005E5EF5C|nr:hypothetical protein [Yersinia frederiksenii]CQI98208.1 Uncharacterised protein [Yersinia frederiksenii]
MSDKYTCAVCKAEFDSNDTYEYRGFYSCDEHFDELQERVDGKRQRIIDDFDAKSKPLRGLDISPDSVIGRANREILKGPIEVCSKETPIEKEYSNGIL